MSPLSAAQRSLLSCPTKLALSITELIRVSRNPSVVLFCLASSMLSDSAPGTARDLVGNPFDKHTREGVALPDVHNDPEHSG